MFGIPARASSHTSPSAQAGQRMVINVGSILGRVTFPFFGLYGASKYAVEALTDSYRYELAPLGIEVVLVQPSAYSTNMYGSAQQPRDRDRGEAYGEIGAIPGKMFETFMGIFQSKDAPDPKDVPNAVVKLVEATKGSRPARVVVGQPLWRRRRQSTGRTHPGTGDRRTRPLVHSRN